MNLEHATAPFSWLPRLALLICCLLGLLLVAKPKPGLAEPAASPPGRSKPKEELRQLFKKATARYAQADSYISRFVQRESSAGKRIEEILIFYFRKEPWSVHFKWLAGEGQGREVVYVKGRYENKIHIVLAGGDVPLLPAGHKIALHLDSPLVKSASKTPITEAGIGPLLDRFGRALDACERDDYRLGRLTLRGEQARPDYDVPLIMVEQTIPPNIEPEVPRGGRRMIGFHSQLFLPVLNEMYDEIGQEVGYYRFDRLELGVRLEETDFDPARIGPASVRQPERSVTAAAGSRGSGS